MYIRNLYRYENDRGGITYSLKKPEDGIDYEIWFRITANEGRMITKDGINLYTVIDVEFTEGWYDVEYVEDNEED